LYLLRNIEKCPEEQKGELQKDELLPFYEGIRTFDYIGCN